RAELLDARRRRAGRVAHDVRASVREHDEIAARELAPSVAGHVEPAAAAHDVVKARELAALDGETPGRAQRALADHRSAEAHRVQEIAQRVVRDGGGEIVHGRSVCSSGRSVMSVARAAWDKPPMKKFLVTYHGGGMPANPDPEMMKQVKAAFGAWLA